MRETHPLKWCRFRDGQLGEPLPPFRRIAQSDGVDTAGLGDPPYAMRHRRLKHVPARHYVVVVHLSWISSYGVGDGRQVDDAIVRLLREHVVESSIVLEIDHLGRVPVGRERL